MGHRTDHRRDAGFTLIEMLIVVLILAILAGIVTFAVTGLTDHGQSSACATDRRVLETAEEAYYAQHKSFATMDTLAPGYIHDVSKLHDVVRADGSPMTDGAPDFELTPKDGTCSD